MAFQMERWFSAVSSRFAVRKYAASPAPEELDSLRETAAQLSTGGVRIVIAESSKVFAPVFLGMGRVTGTNAFAAFIAKEDTPAHLIGYMGEAFVLEATALGLGTCWLGIFNKKEVFAAIDLAEDEGIVCITPLGEPAESYTARPRKSLDVLTGMTREQLLALPDWQQRALECARRAPSAVNAQNWKFLPNENAINVISTGNAHGYGRLNIGIAMLHIELGAAHCGVTGTWEEENGLYRFAAQPPQAPQVTIPAYPVQEQ